MWTDGVDLPYSWLDTNLHKALIEFCSPGSILELHKTRECGLLIGQIYTKVMLRPLCTRAVQQSLTVALFRSD